jgi:hypothetical protein
MTLPNRTTRNRPDTAHRLNDYVTLEQCVKIAAGACEKQMAKRDALERAVRNRVWYRRLWRAIARRRL